MSLNQFKYTFCRIKTITKRYGSRTEKSQFISGYENIDYLHSLISNFVYHCDLRLSLMKSQHEVNYTIEDKSEYYQIKEYYLNEEKLFEMNNQFFMQMTQSMQHSYSLDEGKIKAMDKLVDKLDNDRTLIFCKYIDSREFCEERYKCKVLSFQKSSLGLNLQDYHNTIYFDKVWDYYLMEQSKSRTYRQGQTKDCNYYNLTGDVGLESLIDSNIEKKIGMSEYFKKCSLKDLVNEL